MKHEKWVWGFLLLLGCAPFVIALVFCLVTSLLDFGGVGFHKTSFLEYLFIWILLYWPAYVAGAVLIAISTAKLKKKH